MYFITTITLEHPDVGRDQIEAMLGLSDAHLSVMADV